MSPRGLSSAHTERALCLPLIRMPVLSALLPRPHFTRIPSLKALSPNTSHWGSVLQYMKLGTGAGITQSITGRLRFGSSCIPSGEEDCVVFFFFFHKDRLLKATFLPEDAQMSICR